ncbi:MAG TPA: two-component regulator propeller domain-containing protein [Pyrinomonadaceae bacterium]
MRLPFQSKCISIFTLFAFLSFVAHLRAADKPLFELWNTQQGLPQNTVLSIAQTPDGYLWLATSDGLARFDGVRFKTFKRSNTPAFPSNRLGQLFVDEDGSLWVLTEDTMSVIGYFGGEFKIFRRDVDFKTYDPREPFRAQGSMRFRDGDSDYVFRNGKFVREAVDLSAHERVVATDLENQWILVGGKYFAFGDDGILHELTGERTPRIPDDEIKTVHSVQSDTGTWFLFPRRGIPLLCRFKDGSVQASEFEFDYRSVLGQDGSGNLWVGDYAERLARVSLEAQAPADISKLKIELVSDAASEDRTRVSAMFKDRDGNFWIGTDQGLRLLKDKPVVTVYSRESGLPAENVYAVVEDREGTIWFGVWEANLGSYRDGKLDFEKLKLVSSLMVDKLGRLWTGFGNGVKYRENRRWHLVADFLTDMDGGNSTFVFEHSGGSVWIGGTKVLLRYENGQLRNVTKTEELPGKFMTAVVETRSGDLWFGTSTGLARYSDGNWSSFTEADGMSSGFVRSLYEDEEGILWIGTYDSGLMRYKDGKFMSIQNKDGLYGDGVFCILEDQGWFWMSNNQGIFRVRRNELNDFADGRVNLVYSASYGPGDGLTNVEANGGRQPAGIKSSDGKLWFATAGGLALIDLKDAYGEAKRPEVLIEDATIDQDLTVRGGSELTLDPTRSLIEVNYTAFDFMHAKDIRFRYKLEGLDDEWTNAGTRRTAYFSHLPYGTYVLRVAAANRNGVWDKMGASMKIIVERPFYRTYWFYSLLALAAIGLFAAVYFYRVSQLKALHDARANFTKRLIETQESERRRIALELHDSIGQSLVVIRNRALIGLKKSEDSGRLSEQMREISDASAAALQETREIAHNLHPYQLRHLGLPMALNSLVDDVEAASGIRFLRDIDERGADIPEEAAVTVYRIAQECLNNVVRHSGAANVTFGLTRKGRQLVLTISDDGAGFDTDSVSGGLGLRGLQERAAMLGGKIHISSAPGKGTSVRLFVPVKGSSDEE